MKNDEKAISIEEIEKVNEILQDKTLDIILELMDCELTEEQLILKLDMYPMKFQYYILKLKNLGIVESVEEEVIKENIRIKYRLKAENINMLINTTEGAKNKFESLVGFNNYKNVLKKSFKFSSLNPNLTNKQGAIFIHSSEEKIREFKVELNKLIEKFIEMEVKEETTGYVFLPMLLPYESRGGSDE